MPNLPESLFFNPVLSALRTTHARVAIASGEAIRYPTAVTPFAAIASPATEALRNLRSLLAPDEHVWVAALGESAPWEARLQDCPHHPSPPDRPRISRHRINARQPKPPAPSP